MASASLAGVLSLSSTTAAPILGEGQPWQGQPFRLPVWGAGRRPGVLSLSSTPLSDPGPFELADGQDANPRWLQEGHGRKTGMNA